MVANCTPRDDLSAFSSGTQTTDPRPLEPAGEGSGLPEASEPGPPAATEEAPAAAETPEIPNSETPAAPTELAGGGGGTGGAEPPAAAPDPGGDSAQPEGTGATEMSPAAEPSSPPPPPASTPPAATPPGATPPDPPPAATPEPAAQQFRFVRLVADSDVTAGPLTSIAEFDVLGADGQPLDHSGWVATADSVEQVFVGGAPAAFAIDGQPTTMWHTPWFQVTPPPHPHYLQVDMGRPRTLSGFRYLGRQDGMLDGRVAAYRFFVSVDGVDWGAARATGTLANTDQPQDVPVP